MREKEIKKEERVSVCVSEREESNITVVIAIREISAVSVITACKCEPVQSARD